MQNPNSLWAAQNMEAFEEFYAAVDQMSLEAGAAGDSVKETGGLEAAAPAMDLARERVARATARLRSCPRPPDQATAHALSAMLTALDEFTHADRFDGWIAAWTTAMEHNDRFSSAPSRATDQPPPAGA